MAELKKYPCEICESETQYFMRARLRGDSTGKIDVHICVKCSLVCLNPRHDLNFYSEFYKEAYRKISQNVVSDEANLGLSQQRGAFIEGALSSLISKSDRILEIGSGNGGILNAFKVLGYKNLMGLEPNLAEAAFSNNELGIPTFTGMLHDFSEEEKFRAIIISGTVDHFQEPSEALLKVRSLLAEDGYLYVDSHDVVSQTISTRAFFKADHAFYYSPATLDLLIRKSGFNVVKFQKYNGFNNVIEFSHAPASFLDSGVNQGFFIIAIKKGSQNIDINNVIESKKYVYRSDVRILKKWIRFFHLRKIIIRIFNRVLY